MSRINTISLAFILFFVNQISAQTNPQVGLYRTFERVIKNNNTYSNKFVDVDLTCQYISPSNDTINFMGFYDGDGIGGGDSVIGNVWKIRFLPNEIGEWKYLWKWSDATMGGEGTFICDTVNQGKGILSPYANNPRWLAYNGTEPVWLKSYYESGHGSIAQPFDWVTTNVYQPIIDRGYNHLQVNWLLSLCCFEQVYNDGPAPSTQNLQLFDDGKASSTMRFDVWKLMERHVEWLNQRNIGLHMFLGFDGSKNESVKWENLSDTEKDFYVRYVVARLAPYANIAGWSFVWEVPGDRLTHELGWAKLVKKYDIFNHLRTYEDEHPTKNEYNRPEYNFAAIENHSIYSEDRDKDRKYWKEAWTHHYACLAGYIPGKPAYMIEGNALWRRFWSQRTHASTDDLRQAAWACVTGGTSFNWCGHAGENALVAFGPEGFPFFGDVNEYAKSAQQIDIMADVMNNELDFYKMNPSDLLLSNHDSLSVWCLSEPGEQYLVFLKAGNTFNIKLANGAYKSNLWVNTITGAKIEIPAFSATQNEIKTFTPPHSSTDWVLLVRKNGVLNTKEDAHINSVRMDSSGIKIYVSCDKEILIPENYLYGFKIYDKKKLDISIKSIKTSPLNKNDIIIELSNTIISKKEIVLSYAGTLASVDGSILTPIKDIPIKTIQK